MAEAHIEDKEKGDELKYYPGNDETLDRKFPGPVFLESELYTLLRGHVFLCRVLINSIVSSSSLESWSRYSIALVGVTII